MHIRVLHNYGGKPSGGRRILPGDYEASDERLFGLAQYLVDNGHAVITVSDVKVVDRDGDDKEEETKPLPYNEWSYNDLRAFAKVNDIDLAGATKKDEIVAAIEVWRLAHADASEDETE